MNNARCKSMLLTFLLLLSIIPHIYARDNGQATEESEQLANESVMLEEHDKAPAESQSEYFEPKANILSDGHQIDQSANKSIEQQELQQEQAEPQAEISQNLSDDLLNSDDAQKTVDQSANKSIEQQELHQEQAEPQAETSQNHSDDLLNSDDVQKTVDQSALDFTLPMPSVDEQTLQDALFQDLSTISADKGVQQLLNKATNEMLENYNEYAIKQLQQLDCILEELSTNLSSNNLIPTRNRGNAVKKIQALRAPLFYLKNTNIVPLKVEDIYVIATQIQDVADYTFVNLENGIDVCQQYDMASFNPPMLNNEEDVEQQIKRALIENDKAINKLSAKASRIGLHFYNIAWRSMHKKVFDPWKKYYGTQLSLGAIWLTTAAFFTWYYFGGNSVPGLPANFGKWLRNKVGWPAQTPNDYIINDSSSEFAAIQSALSALQEMDEALKRAAETPEWWGFLGQRGRGMSADEIQALRNKYIRTAQEEAPNLNLKDALNKPVGWLGRLEHRISQFGAGKFMIGGLVLLPTGQALLSTIAPSLLDWLDKTVQKADNFLLGGVYRNKRVDAIVTHSNTRFIDIIGNENAKKYFSDLIGFLKNPESWERSGIAPKTGILLFGETRTGKSYFIDAFYGELINELGEQADFKLWPISYSMILEKGIDWVLEQAREYAPCIIVIEEIDLLGLQRTENKQLLASFMTALNSCLQRNTIDKTVIIIGTTNKLENIELALRQMGRFGISFHFERPTFEERKLYIERELTKLAVMIEQFDIELLARLTEGCVFEIISSMIKGALTAAKIDRVPISQESLEHSLERFVYGISLEPCKLDNKQKRIIATHLAGEIVATQLLDPNLQIAKATIKNVRAKIDEQSVYMQYFESTKQNPVEYGKVFYCHDHDVLPLNSTQDKISQCKIYRAGHAAEAILLGASSDYHANDKHRSYELALAVSGEGIDISKVPPAAQNQFFDQAYKMVSQCETEIRTLLQQHKDEIVAIANMLIEKQTIGESDISTVIKKTEGPDDGTPQA